jgi:hypothetical protein
MATKLESVKSAMVAKYQITDAMAEELIARGAASTWGVFQDAYPELTVGDRFWNKMNELVEGMPYQPKP